MEKEVTIYDIAQKLSLSPATVSRALNDHPAINSETKTTIANTARAMGYRANRFASNLRRKQTHTLGVIVPRLNSYFMSTVLAGMEKVANEASYNLIITQSLESFAKEKANAQTMFNSRVDGLLISLAFDTDSLSHIEPFIQKNIPVLFFDRVMAHKKCTSIVIDNVQAGYEATMHLIEQGCRRIVHVTGNLQRNVYADRYKGYQLALAKQGMALDESWVMVTDLTPESGVETAQEIRQHFPTADGLFVTNDGCAVSCIGALKQAGIRIPHDLKVVGFNNDMLAQVVDPKLTTIDYPGYEMGKLAAQSLIHHLQGQSSITATNTIILRSELIIRESSLQNTNIWQNAPNGA